MQSRVTDDRFWISLGEFERRPVWKSAKYFTVSGRNTDRLCIGFVLGTGKLPCMTVHDRATAVRNRAKFHGKRTVCTVVVQDSSLLHGRHLMNKEAARLRSISQ